MLRSILIYRSVLLCGVLLCSATAVRADRTLCSTVLQPGNPGWLSEKEGEIHRLRDGFRFTPPQDPKTIEIKLPLPQNRDFRLYSELAFETQTKDANSAITVELEAFWPKYDKLVKKRIPLKKGKQQHKLYLHQAGYRTELRELVLTFHHEPDAKDEKNRSELSSPIELRNFRLNAVDYSIKPLEKQVDASLSSPLPPGLSERAGKAAEAMRERLNDNADRFFSILKNRNSSYSANASALDNLYFLRGNAAWLIEQAALRIDAEPHGMLYGWTGGADKILRDGTFPGSIGGTAKLELARNESEGVQVALWPLADLTGVSVCLTEFKQEDGTVFPADRISAAPVGYITPTAPAYWSEYINHLLPDPLLNYLAEFPVEKERFQPVWIDFSAPKEQRPGLYRGQVEFHSGNRLLVSIPVELTVRNFQLPDRNSLPVIISSGEFNHPLYERESSVRREFDAFMFTEGDGDPSGLSDAAQRLVKRNFDFFHLLRSHRIEFHDIYRSTRRVIPGWRRRIINEFNTMYCLGYDNDRNVMQNFERQFPQMREEGVADRAYVYGNDEIRTSDKRAFGNMKKSYGSLKKAFPELKTAATALDYSCGEKTDTTEEVDIWIMPPDAYSGNRSAAERARKRGKQVWYYPCNWPYPPAANLLLESRATATRMVVGVMPWKFQADGVLYYSTTMLRRQTDTDSLLGKWSRSGNVQDLRDGLHGYDGEYLLSTSPGEGNDYAKIECWTTVPNDFRRPLLVEFEILPEKFTGGGDASLTAELRLNYHDGVKTDRNFFEINPDSAKWQKVRKTIKISGPVRNMLLAFRLKSDGAKVRIRNVTLRQPGVMIDRRITADRIVTGGPVLGAEYCYSMFRSNGDGTLIYPGPDGALPTVRLKFLRDGLEDYEYLTLLKQAAEEVRVGKCSVADKTAWLAEAEALLAVDKAVCAGMSKYVKNGSDLLAFRSRIADLLEQVTR